MNMRIQVIGSQGTWVFIRPVTQWDMNGQNVIGNWMCQQPGVFTDEPCNNVNPDVMDFSFETWVEQGMPD